MAEEGGSSSKIEPRNLWTLNRLQTLLGVKPEKADKFISGFSADEGSGRALGRFLDEVEVPACYFVPAGESVLCSVELPTPQQMRKKLVVMHRASPEVAISKENVGEACIIMELTKNVMDQLNMYCQSVYLSTLTNPSNQAGWSDLLAKDLMDKYHVFLASLHVTVGLMKGHTWLPHPPRDALPTSGGMNAGGAGAGGKDRVHVLEGAVITWTKQIRHVLKQDPEVLLKEGQNPEPSAELKFWRSKAANLNSIHSQLGMDALKKVLKFLETNKSTYTAPFSKLQKEVEEAREEANDNVKFLATLTKTIDKLTSDSADFETIEQLFEPILHNILLVWCYSKFYNTPTRLAVLIREICNSIITQAVRYISGPDIFGMISSEETSECYAKLENTLRICTAFKDAYVVYREIAANQHGEGWKMKNEALFVRLDAFRERCRDALDFTRTVMQFTKLERVEIGGTKGKVLSDCIVAIYEEFMKCVEEFKSVTYDIMDVGESQFEHDYFQFRMTVKDLDRRLGSLLGSAFDDLDTINLRIKLFDIFEGLLERPIIQAELEKKHKTLLSQVEQNLTAVETGFVEAKDKVDQCYDDSPIFSNLPPAAGAIYWARCSRHRINEPMSKIAFYNLALRETPEEFREIKKQYTALDKLLESYELQRYSTWEQTSVEAAKEKLKMRLLRRQEKSGLLKVNFDPALVRLLREVRFFLIFDIQVPEAALEMFSRVATYRQWVAQLEHIVGMYNAVLTELLPVEEPLLEDRIAKMDQVLSPGLTELKWRSEDKIPEFIEGTMKVVSDVSGVVEIMKGNLRNISGILSQWCKEPIVARQKGSKPMALDEFDLKHKERVGMRMMMQTDGGKEIHKFVKDSSEALKVSKVATNWKAYVDFVNNIVIEGFVSSIAVSLQNLCEILDPLIIAKHEMLPLFDVKIELAGTSILFDPPFASAKPGDPSLRATIDGWLKDFFATVTCMQRLDTGNGDYLNEIREHFQMQCLLALVSELIDNTELKCMDYRETFMQHSYLWTESVDKAFEKFLNEDSQDLVEGFEEEGLSFREIMERIKVDIGRPVPKLEKFDQKIQFFKKMKEDLSNMKTPVDIHWLRVHAQPVKLALVGFARTWEEKYVDYIKNYTEARIKALCTFVDQQQIGLGPPSPVDEPENEKLLYSTMTNIRDVKLATTAIKKLFPPIRDLCQLLKKHHVTHEGLVELDKAPNKWDEVIRMAFDVKEQILPLQSEEVLKIRNKIDVFAEELQGFCHEFREQCPFDPKNAISGEYDLSYDTMNDYYNKTLAIRERANEFNDLELLFDMQMSSYRELKECQEELVYLKNLWDGVVMVKETFQSWNTILWDKIDTDSLVQSARDLQTQVKNMPKQVKGWALYRWLTEEVKNMATVLPLVNDLHGETMRDRHWTSIMAITQKTFEKGPEFCFKDLLDLKLHEFAEDVSEVVDQSAKEAKIEKKLSAIRATWSKMPVTFDTSNPECPLLGELGEVIEKLDGDSLEMMGMTSQGRFIEFCKPLVDEWSSKLRGIDGALSVWTKVQANWQRLEPIFMQSADIRSQLPDESKRFEQMDAAWKELMNDASNSSLIVEICNAEGREAALKNINEGIDSCEKALNEYLEQKKKAFPRFYFVANQALLDILSNGARPLKVAEYLGDIFDGVKTLNFSKDEKMGKIACGHVSKDTEKVEWADDMHIDGAVEAYLLQLEGHFRVQLRIELEHARMTADNWEVDNPREFWLEGFCAQLALVGTQIMWTEETTRVFEEIESGSETAMKEYKRVNDERIEKLIKRVQTPLSKDVRNKIITLITIDVHGRDIIESMVIGKITDPTDFKWSSQLRFHWLYCPQGMNLVSYTPDEFKTCVIKICDWTTIYCFEYVGNCGRLVITPLTDRCYITLTQAMGLILGGAPAGPAGTGKTETTKDLSRALGLQIVVFNCSDQMTYQTMAQIFMGIASTGCWGCFDEFNRISIEVLSVVSTQYKTILDAIRAQVPQFLFADEETKLINTCGAFITMNPGYAGRQELPENVKALFRSVAMMVPNRQTIMSVKLASVGFSQMDVIGKKFCILYALCEQQLSKQRHYDFGLRNILSVLRTSGGVKRSEPPDADEEMLFMRTVRDMNLSKLVADDVPLFLALLRDIFPKVTDPPKKVYKMVEDGSRALIKQNFIIDWDTWVLKIIQLYETSLVRHGFMLVGPTLCGKTEIREILTNCLINDGQPHKMQVMNPKAITDSQMYGVKDPVSEEWTPGVFASIWQKYNNRALKWTTWIVCDGPVDAIWIENLNTVLDDNKILTLANNDRIPMTDNCKIVFEVQDLRNASPATVSRAGIIYVSASDLGWQPITASWLLRRPEINASRSAEVDILKPLFDKWLKAKPPNSGAAEDFFDWHMRNLKLVMPCNDSILICQTLNLLSASLKSYVDENSIPAEDTYKRILTWCIMWGFGGLLEPQGRQTIWDKFVEVLTESKCKDTIPPCSENQTIFEWVPDWTDKARPWKLWEPAEWKPPKILNFSALLIPTMDSVRAEYVIDIIGCFDQTKTPPSFKSSMLVGAPGTAKTSTALMYMSKFSPDAMLTKRLNLSSATQPLGFQKSIEAEIERKTGKTFCPPGGKKLTIFIDDASMPIVNKWGDQITNELCRQLIEMSGFYFLDKDKRGDFKSIEGLQYIGAMGHPGGGKNDIPNRLKSKFMCFNMVLPSTVSVDNIFGSIMKSKFSSKAGAKADVIELSKKLTAATVDVWDRVKSKLLPTPLRFHYIFNMRDLSRVFQGIMECPVNVVTSETILVRLWKHENQRVFSDKLSRDVDKQLVEKTLKEFMPLHFGEALAAENQETEWFADFLRDIEFDDETGEELGAPKVYEPAEWEITKSKAYEYLGKYNELYPSRAMNLVLFDEAMQNMMKINRTIQQKRGSTMLVGVGGSGKQSLARLSAFTSQHYIFQITITKQYNDNALFEDLKNLCIRAGAKGESVTFIFTDAEVKSENFLEYMNSLLATGEVVGLFAKDERDAMCGDVRNDFVKENPTMEENLLNMYNYLMDRLRDNLHVCLCFSPVNAKFPIRAQKFPAVFTVNINWFMPWPETALVAVSSSFLGSYKLDCSSDERERLYALTGAFQAMTRDMCEVYYSRWRKNVYVTPKSFLCLIDFYKQLYQTKYEDINVQERSVNVGLQKLKEASEFVEKLKIELKEQDVVLRAEEKKTTALLEKVMGEKAKADKKAEQVNAQKAACLATADKINEEKAEAQVELNKALPFLHEAESACNSITKKDITEIKTNNKPVDIIKLTFDGLMIIQGKPVVPVKTEERFINKVTAPFLADSYEDVAKKEVNDMNFLNNLLDFAANEKDNINDETCELLDPYLRYDEDPAKNWSPFSHKVLEPELAGKASGAAAGLCKFVGAMVMYHGAAKIVKPKMDALKVAEARLAKAMAELAAAEAELAKVMAEVAELDAELAKAQGVMKQLQDSAAAMQRQMDAANKLLSGLSGENARWTEDSKNFALRRKRLIGDVGCVCAFVVYCGPFNSEFRDKLYGQFLAETKKRGVPGHEVVEQVSFLVDQASIGEWALEGLPSDELSIQNAIMVTRSSRYPLMVDPQGQANRWIKSREKQRISENPAMCITTLTAKNLKDQIEFTMGEGLCLIIENVENEVDPMLDPVLDKAIIKKGKNLYINVSDQNMDYKEIFSLYLTSRLPNPHFSPELSAKATVIDFTVTMKGLEQQLLAKCIGMEMKSLEDTLAQLEEDVTNNTKSLQLLDKQLLDRLSNSQGNLLEDTELIEVLANTKAKSKEVEGKLKEADERKIEINEKREQFRPVATRGSIMYFNMTDMTNVANPITAQPSGWMYNCSLLQFLEQFEVSVRNSEKAQPTAKRVDKIIHFLTYQVYRYMNRGLYERDKMMFKLMVTLKIMQVANQITGADVSMLLKGGSALDVKAERQNPFKWLPEKVWLNVIQMSRQPFGPDQMMFFREIQDFMQRNEAAWRKWFDENSPESEPIPDYDDRINMDRTLGPFLRLITVRCMREDRTGVGCAQFVESMLDSRFVAPVTDAISDIYDESSNRKPVLYLLTAGSDPTFTIDELAKKKKKYPTDKVSMGEGQEKVAREKNNAAFLTGGWVILQNSHLGIGYMGELEDVLLKTPEIEETYRLWITSEITNRFPIGLLQICIKVTLEPPAGLRAGLDRTYSTMVSQELLDKIDLPQWRTLVFCQSFLHSIVQERRKFGPIGWCIPYEYNNSDLDACLQFLERHVNATIMTGMQISWITVQYMIAEAQYGGRITDDLDRELFLTYTQKWFNDDIWKASFTFNNYASDYNYKIPEGLEIQQFKEAIDTFPVVDSPLIFGLHTNADLNYRLKEASEMISTIIETQPKDSGGSGGKSMDEIVKDLCLDLLSKMPPDFVEEIFRAQITKLKGPPGVPDKGFGAPLNIFLFQELQRLQNIIQIVRTNLKNIAAAIDGTVVMTTELMQDLGMLFDARVPIGWTNDASGQEISWLMPNMGGWFTGLTERQNMLNTWLENGRGVMKAYWLTGFTNAQGFLTGMRQEVTRQHKKDQWALDDVISHTEVLAIDQERIRDVPEEGQNIWGLFVEGGKWSRADGRLEESEPKKLFMAMPAIYVTATTARDMKAMGLNYGPFGPYNSAVYKYPKRNDRYLIFRLMLKTELHPFHWKLRGVCLMAQTE
eukprot:TRINITY_DN2095_c0_g1_i5.p1 TRINITY_DN2095_c0_g1~~TRINITY_DN2095_c0_g1_i5.p1  ORF type:complete len:4649 (-),score=1173.32 TRINITY_DN2095_c0_g1_i5:61-14007(-)